ncbi:hypothetical protein [Streptomyces sp. NPDC088146]
MPEPLHARRSSSLIRHAPLACSTARRALLTAVPSGRIVDEE